LAEYAEFNLRVLDGMRARIDVLTGLIENQLDGPRHGASGAQ
jgi:hypothetical protein